MLLRGKPVRIHRPGAAIHRAPHRIVHDHEQHGQLVQGRGVMDGGGIAEHVGAVADHGHDRTFGPRQLGAERGAGAPTQTRRGARSEIEIRRVERAMLRKQRVFVDDDAFCVLGAVDAMADPYRIRRRLAGGGIDAQPSRRRSCLARSSFDPAPACRDRLRHRAIPERVRSGPRMSRRCVPVIAMSQGNPRIG